MAWLEVGWVGAASDIGAPCRHRVSFHWRQLSKKSAYKFLQASIKCPPDRVITAVSISRGDSKSTIEPPCEESGYLIEIDGHAFLQTSPDDEFPSELELVVEFEEQQFVRESGSSLESQFKYTITGSVRSCSFTLDLPLPWSGGLRNWLAKKWLAAGEDPIDGRDLTACNLNYSVPNSPQRLRVSWARHEVRYLQEPQRIRYSSSITFATIFRLLFKLFGRKGDGE